MSMLTNPRALSLLSAATLCFAAAPAPAVTQEPPRDAAALDAYLRAKGETYHRAPDIEQEPEEVRRTQALNAEIAARNELAAQEEAANRAAYEAEQARYAEIMAAAEAERLNYEAAVRAAEAARAQYEAEMQAWRAQVRACERGVRAACAPMRDPRY